MIIPTLRVDEVDPLLRFLVDVIGFTLAGRWPANGDPAFAILLRDASELHVSSHSGDGPPGFAVAILTPSVADVYARVSAHSEWHPKRGSPVHHAPVRQTWETLEFYVDVPGGHTLRFIER